MQFTLQATSESDTSWIRDVFRREWGGEFVVTRGRKLYPERLEGLVASDEARHVGLLTYEIVGNDCEMVTLNAFTRQAGIGTALVEQLQVVARERGCARIWLVTTNDNLEALRFYQRRGFRLAEVVANGIDESRRLKPSIPLIGNFGIPIRDEIILEMLIS